MNKILPDFTEFNIDKVKPFSNIKLIVMDLDGTLLESSDSDIPQKIIEFSRKLKYSRSNVRLTIATGRTLSGAHDLLTKIKIQNNTPIILYNGSLILNNKYEVLYQVNIPVDSIKKIFDLSTNYNVKTIAYCFKGIESHHYNEFAFGISNIDTPKHDYNRMPVIWVSSADELGIHTPSAIVIHTKGEEDIFEAVFDSLKNIDGISYMRGKTYIEIVPKGVNKGSALEYISKNVLEIEQSEVLAIGDNDNDAEMLSWAGIGVAVESASELAKKSSKYIAKRGILEGAVEVIQIVRQAKRFLS